MIERYRFRSWTGHEFDVEAETADEVLRLAAQWWIDSHVGMPGEYPWPGVQWVKRSATGDIVWPADQALAG